MNETFETGDIRATYISGRKRYVRIGQIQYEDGDRIYIQDCDGAGFLLTGKGRWLLKDTLRRRYRLHYRPEPRP